MILFLWYETEQNDWLLWGEEVLNFPTIKAELLGSVKVVFFVAVVVIVSFSTKVWKKKKK